MRHCNQCGYDMPDAEFVEGVCAYCYRDNQDACDQHNAKFDRWEGFTDRERDDAIRSGWAGH